VSSTALKLQIWSCCLGISCCWVPLLLFIN